MAPSSSDESDDSSNNDDSVSVEETHNRTLKRTRRHDADETSDSDPDDGEEMDDMSGGDSEDDSQGTSENDSDVDEYSSVDDDPDTSLPIAERLRRLEQQGFNHKHVRQRREKALQPTKRKIEKHRDDNDSSSGKPLKRSKNAPTEASSKRSDFYKQKPLLTGLGVDLNAHRYRPRDPRLSHSSDPTNKSESTDRHYEFLIDMRKQEIDQLRRRIAARKTGGRKGQLLRKKLGIAADSSALEEEAATLKRYQQELANYERQELNRTVKRKVKQQLVEERGKQYRPKRVELKKLELEAKFDEIKKRGGNRAVNKVLEKKRKRNKSRDAARMGRVG